MRAFAIVETNVTAYPTLAEARQAVAAAADSEPRLVVSSEAELNASPLGLGQLVEIWNSFAGVVPFDDLKPVRKFTDRKTAVARIWRAIQRLAPVATETAPSGPQGAEGAPKKTPSSQEATAREGSKKAQIIELLRRPEGATLQALCEATGWQAHSVRGFLSTLNKKAEHNITRLKRDDGTGVYFLTE
jgi:hypothetical protein